MIWKCWTCCNREQTFFLACAEVRKKVLFDNDLVNIIICNEVLDILGDY